MKSASRKALKSTQEPSKASPEDTSSTQIPDWLEDEWIKEIEARIEIDGTGHQFVQQVLETIRSTPRLLKVYNDQRAYQESQFSFSAAYSSDAKSELFGPDLSGPGPPKVIEQLKPQSATAGHNAFSAIPGAESWADVSLKFVGEDAVRVTIKRKYVGQYHFALLGLMSKKSGKETKSNRYWAMLQLVAINRGLMPYQKLKRGKAPVVDPGSSIKTPKDKEYLAAQQNIKRLQTELERIFGLKDAFKDWNGQGWEAKFVIKTDPLENYDD